MRKILAILASAFCISASATETVTIVYGWSPSDVAANFHRTLVNEANKIQSKYNFVFDTKPGAGASIAANYVGAHPENSILATSSAFFIRPNFFPNESYDVSKFKELMPQCDAPLEVVSKRYHSWSEVPTDKPLTIAVSGLGITTHLVATEVAKKYPNMRVIPFKSTTDSVLSTISGVTDFSVNFMGDGEQYVNSKNEQDRVYALGITGTKADGKVPTFVSQGFPKTLESMNAPAHLVVSTSVPDAKYKEWREILVRAGRSKSVHDAFAVDHCVSLNQMSDDAIQPWFYKANNTWKTIASGISLK
jgi:tripartite-type tricarboxylate transporter receptor subunit TctC